MKAEHAEITLHKRASILAFIDDWLDHYKYPPTRREISKAVGISSTSVVNFDVTALEKQGMLEVDAGVSRGIRLTEKALDFLAPVSSEKAA